MSKLRIAPRGAPPQPDPPKVAALPDAARDQLGMLVTELGGIRQVLDNFPGSEADYDLHVARSMWVGRIAHDLGEMECRSYPVAEAAP